MKKINIIIICLVSLILGALIIRQGVAISKSLDLTKQDNLATLAYQIVENANNIFDMQAQYNDLKAKDDSFSSDVKDKTQIKTNMQNKINDYRATNGLDAVSGRGIEIKAEGVMLTEEIVDLINGIRNTKPSAIAINNLRIIYRSYFIVNTDGKLEFDNNKVSFPILIEIIGDPDELTKSLSRSGGILDVLKSNSFGKLNFSIERKDNLSLPPYNGKISFRSAKNT